MSISAKCNLEHGDQFPYDAPDWWINAPETLPAPPPTDYAHRAARGILANMTDRRVIKWGFEEVDEDVRLEIIASVAEIIREAVRQNSP